MTDRSIRIIWPSWNSLPPSSFSCQFVSGYGWRRLFSSYITGQFHQQPPYISAWYLSSGVFIILQAIQFSVTCAAVNTWNINEFSVCVEDQWQMSTLLSCISEYTVTLCQAESNHYNFTYHTKTYILHPITLKFTKLKFHCCVKFKNISLSRSENC